MKKLLLLWVISMTTVTTYAQIELKANPIALLFEVASVQVEYCSTPDWGFEADLFTFDGFGYFNGIAKYYLSPKLGSDRFHIGAFAGTVFGEGESYAGLGFMLGYKILTPKNLLFDVGLGVGRAFGRDSYDDLVPLPLFKLSLGYRFPKKKSDK